MVIYGNGGTHVHHVVVDHCTVMWASDEMVSIYSNATDVTLQWSIVAEACNRADNGVCPPGKGILVGSGDDLNTVSIHHNLIAHVEERVPAAGGDTIDFRNNVVYNWLGNNGPKFGTTCSWHPMDSSPSVNFVNNHYIAGPDSFRSSIYGYLGGDGTGAMRRTSIYLAGNYSPACPTGCPSEWDHGWTTPVHPRCTSCPCSEADRAVVSYVPSSELDYRALTAFAAPTVSTSPTSEVEALVLSGSGASRPRRDREDTRIVSEVRTRTGRVGMDGTHPALRSGTPPTDTDRDGMPDTWERAHGLDPARASDGSIVAPNGYTNVENYLNELAGDPIP